MTLGPRAEPAGLMGLCLRAEWARLPKGHAAGTVAGGHNTCSAAQQSAVDTQSACCVAAWQEGAELRCVSCWLQELAPRRCGICSPA